MPDKAMSRLPANPSSFPYHEVSATGGAPMAFLSPLDLLALSLEGPYGPYKAFKGLIMPWP